ELLESGRDRLLELASFDAERAEALKDKLREADAHSPWPFLGRLFDHYGVDQEEHSEQAWILKPGNHMREPFPELPDDGVTVTDDRATALARDDMQFLTWEHPLVTGALDMILGSHRGKASVSLLKNPKVKAGTLLLELAYTVETVAPKHLQADRFLPVTTIRRLVDGRGRDLSAAISHEALCKQCHKLEKPLARKIVASQKALLEQLLKDDENKARGEADAIIQTALTAMREQQDLELRRLKALREKNPLVRDEEIDFLERQTAALETHLQDARYRLEAVRVIVAGD
ncbi:MAG: RNA polymerase-associated protein RapA, partial [Alloalcanivorax venustensis]